MPAGQCTPEESRECIMHSAREKLQGEARGCPGRGNKGLWTQAIAQLLRGFKRRFTLSGLLRKSRVHQGPSLWGEVATTVINGLRHGASKNS